MLAADRGGRGAASLAVGGQQAECVELAVSGVITGKWRWSMVRISFVS
jgi:hypothetical protein